MKRGKGEGSSGGAVRVLAVASRGGHWEQLMQLRPAFDTVDTIYASTDKGYAERDGIANIEIISDSNRNSGLGMAQTMVQSWRLVRRVRPQAIVTTGALPGLCCIIAGRLLGAHTTWIDSIANSEQMSMSGRASQYLAHETLTQWPHLAGPRGPSYAGSIL